MTTEQQQRAIDDVRALREVTRTTGMKTTRAVNSILQALSDADLVVVARALRESNTGGAQ